MKAWLIRLLLRWLGADVPAPKPFSYFYALVTNGDRVAELTTNRWRARAIALEREAKGEAITLWQCAPIKRVSLRESKNR